MDPLSVSCALLLTQSDIKKALGATVPSGSVRVKDVADPERGVTGKARCRFGSTDGGKTGKVTVLLTTYNNAASAAKQVTLTRSSEEDLGATSSAATVRGYPARILLRDGGLIVLQYDTWTLSVVAADKLASADKLTSGLPLLAEQVLARILKNA
ncbi:hypothetical protein GCM10011594_08310 [Nakamurella endophytica]|uniref:Uncharacterized protein n=1 Tax=Nakamurella endophytica TaxID=1748367 RepID=A0A917SNM2_9ACTN|nr:hypothetical protein GCM10011594_08310 [Nakamurella endophytica]